VRFCLAVVGLLFVALVLILPWRDLRMRHVEGFIPMIDAIMSVGDLVTATLLFAQASVFRSRALTILAASFVYAGLLFIPHALTFPGAFAPAGLLDAGVNTTSWLSMFRRAPIPVAIMLYVWLRQAEAAAPGTDRPASGTLVAVLVALGLAVVATAVATLGHDLLPAFYVNSAEVIYARSVAYESVLLILFAVTTIVLFRARSSVLDMWLLVALAGWLVQSLLIMTLHGRFTAGWYLLFLVTLFSHLVVMLALLVESNRLYARLALAMSARNRERDARLMSIDAVAGAISHEVGQPLAAVATNAGAGLNWLTRPRPDVEMAIQSLRAAIVAGQHANDVIRSLRAMFAKRPGRTTEFSLNDLVRETAALLDLELDTERVALRLDLDPELPLIRADRVQMQQVLVNLFANAIESLGATRGRPHRLAVRSAPLDSHVVLLEVADNGVGMSPEMLDNVFEAFFTTKPTGTGLGLSLCRTIVELHGGSLWVTQGQDHGATFHLQLPALRRARSKAANLPEDAAA
jgi:signal transduction histidine kinase